MCGRYALSQRPESLVEEFDIAENRVEEPLAPDFNVAPTKPVYAVVERSSAPAPEASAEGQGNAVRRQLRVLTWGLVPSWAKDPSIGNRLINARVETVAEKPAFRRALAARRCLLPADGYFEWYATEEKTERGKPKKQPFFIRPRGGGILAMAGLYEIWRDPDKPDDAPDRFRWTCTVITTDAPDDLGRIHDRMPLMVEPEAWGSWLDPGADKAAVLDLLVPAAPGRLEAYPVSTTVNSVKNNGPELIEPISLS